jgi:hypothetical protein
VAATKKFEKEKHISLYLGDSGEQIGNVLALLRSPCLFWLDGHYSEGFTAKGKLNTPIIEELTQIFAHPIKTHVILVDDARCFTGKDDYPTLEYLREFVKRHNPNLQFTVEHDIIRIHI